jgi:hypothetical protein
MGRGPWLWVARRGRARAAGPAPEPDPSSAPARRAAGSYWISMNISAAGRQGRGDTAMKQCTESISFQRFHLWRRTIFLKRNRQNFIEFL